LGRGAVLYAPHFQLRAFDTLTEPARLEALRHLLEALTLVNVAWLREHPGAPWLYESGVRYEEDPLCQGSCRLRRVAA
jgi:hypothetical protein